MQNIEHETIARLEAEIQDAKANISAICTLSRKRRRVVEVKCIYANESDDEIESAVGQESPHTNIHSTIANKNWPDESMERDCTGLIDTKVPVDFEKM
jgi:hypothetical protein